MANTFIVPVLATKSAAKSGSGTSSSAGTNAAANAPLRSLLDMMALAKSTAPIDPLVRSASDQQQHQHQHRETSSGSISSRASDFTISSASSGPSSQRNSDLTLTRSANATTTPSTMTATTSAGGKRLSLSSGKHSLMQFVTAADKGAIAHPPGAKDEERSLSRFDLQLDMAKIAAAAARRGERPAPLLSPSKLAQRFARHGLAFGNGGGASAEHGQRVVASSPSPPRAQPPPGQQHFRNPRAASASLASRTPAEPSRKKKGAKLHLRLDEAHGFQLVSDPSVEHDDTQPPISPKTP